MPILRRCRIRCASLRGRGQGDLRTDVAPQHPRFERHPLESRSFEHVQLVRFLPPALRSDRDQHHPRSSSVAVVRENHVRHPRARRLPFVGSPSSPPDVAFDSTMRSRPSWHAMGRIRRSWKGRENAGSRLTRGTPPSSSGGGDDGCQRTGTAARSRCAA